VSARADDALHQSMQALRRHYTELFERHGDSPQAAQWSDRATQERRMEILLQVGEVADAKILDFGCGTGHLLEYLRRTRAFQGEYVGYDLSPELIAAASQKLPRARFEARDILRDGIPEDFDYVLVNGVFNNRAGDNWQMLTTLLTQVFAHVRRALAFNALSTYVDFTDPQLFYVNPEAVFRFCKERLSPSVTIRHDYRVKPDVIPFEFSVYVYRTPFAPVHELLEAAER